MKVQRRFICEGCHRERPGNPRLKPGQQRFCSGVRCQLKRKALWQRKRLQTCDRYQQDQAEAVDTWRRSEDGHRYDRERKRRAVANRDPPASVRTQPELPDSVPGPGLPGGRYRLDSLDDISQPSIEVVLVALTSADQDSHGHQSDNSADDSEMDALEGLKPASKAALEVGAGGADAIPRWTRSTVSNPDP